MARRSVLPADTHLAAVEASPLQSSAATNKMLAAGSGIWGESSALVKSCACKNQETQVWQGLGADQLKCSCLEWLWNSTRVCMGSPVKRLSCQTKFRCTNDTFASGFHVRVEEELRWKCTGVWRSTTQFRMVLEMHARVLF